MNSNPTQHEPSTRLEWAKWTALVFLFLNLIAVVIIYVATKASTGVADWRLIRLALIVLAGIPLALTACILIGVQVMWPVFLWLAWKYFSIIQVLLGIPLGTWLGRQIIMAPVPRLGLNAWLYRQVSSVVRLENGRSKDE